MAYDAELATSLCAVRSSLLPLAAFQGALKGNRFGRSRPERPRYAAQRRLEVEMEAESRVELCCDRVAWLSDHTEKS